MAALAAALVAALLILIGLAWAWSRDRRGLRRSEAEVAHLHHRLARGEELEAQLYAALDTIDLGVLLARTDGTVVFRNDAAGVLARARHTAALVEAATQELLSQALRGEPGTREVDLFGPPSSTFLVRAFPLTTRVQDTERLAGAFVLVEDITERRRIDQVRHDFVANISHELRTPIGVMAVSGDALAEEHDPETVRRLAANIADQAVRMSETIDDLLELASIESKDERPTEPVDLVELLAGVVEEFRPAAEQADVAIETTVPFRLVVPGDRRQLRTALANLLDNAVKYGGGGKVTVELEEWQGDALVHVSDTGVGIPDRDLDRVFERFYRVDRARSRDTGGTGLGLAIVRHVAHNHRGEVSVTSREGEGSTFSLRLPMAVEPGGTIGEGG